MVAEREVHARRPAARNEDAPERLPSLKVSRFDLVLSDIEDDEVVTAMLICGGSWPVCDGDSCPCQRAAVKVRNGPLDHPAVLCSGLRS